MLRQPSTVSKKEKYEYVEDVIDMLGMEDFSDAVVGSPGEGLNVEQRKLLTIGVELAAKPALLIFLDEPTSGLDSQSSWAICSFLRKLAEHGQAVLSTIHQPSALLFQEFDRLLFLAKGGRTVYFGDIGDQSRTLLDYFESNGARVCGANENVSLIDPLSSQTDLIKLLACRVHARNYRRWSLWKGHKRLGRRVERKPGSKECSIRARSNPRRASFGKQ
jgi:ABC-type multidrug transport system ATPase subunit